MIRLPREQTVDIVVTLNEKATKENSIYLFRFAGQFTNKEFAVILEDESTLIQRPRFNLFRIDVDAVFGTADSGTYYYSVYELITPETAAIGPVANAGVLYAAEYQQSPLETGIAKLTGETPQVTVDYEPAEKEIITY